MMIFQMLLFSPTCETVQVQWTHNGPNFSDGQDQNASFVINGAEPDVFGSNVNFTSTSMTSFGAGLDETTDNYAYTYLLRGADESSFANAKAANDYVEVSFEPAVALQLQSINFGFFTGNSSQQEFNAGNFRMAVEVSEQAGFANPTTLFSDIEVGAMLVDNGYLFLENNLDQFNLSAGIIYTFRFYLFDRQNSDSLNRVRFDDLQFPSIIKSTCDSDGVDDAVEDAGPGNGDANGDGMLDSTQPNVASIVDGGGNYVALEITNNGNGNCEQITAMTLMDESELSIQDSDFEYSLGLVNFTLQCANDAEGAQVKYYWYGLSEAPSAYRKFGPPVPNGTAEFANASDLVSVTEAIETVNGQSVYTVTYTLIDDQPGDDVAEGSAGIIVDPTGPADGYVPCTDVPQDNTEASNTPGYEPVNVDCPVEYIAPVFTAEPVIACPVQKVTYDQPAFTNSSYLQVWSPALGTTDLPAILNARHNGYITQFFCSLDTWGLPALPANVVGSVQGDFPGLPSHDIPETNPNIVFPNPQYTRVPFTSGTDVNGNDISGMSIVDIGGTAANGNIEQTELIQADFWIVVPDIQGEIGFGQGGGTLDAGSLYIGEDLNAMCNVSYFTDGATFNSLPDELQGTYNTSSVPAVCGYKILRARHYINDINAFFEVAPVVEFRPGDGQVAFTELPTIAALGPDDNTPPTLTFETIVGLMDANNNVFDLDANFLPSCNVSTASAIFKDINITTPTCNVEVDLETANCFATDSDPSSAVFTYSSTDPLVTISGSNFSINSNLVSLPYTTTITATGPASIAPDECPLTFDVVLDFSAPDTDGDGLLDICDLDDDNDGILDTEVNNVNWPSSSSAPSMTAVTDSGYTSNITDIRTNGNIWTISNTVIPMMLHNF